MQMYNLKLYVVHAIVIRIAANKAMTDFRIRRYRSNYKMKLDKKGTLNLIILHQGT